MISNRNYIDSKVFDTEMSDIFHNGWFYVGLKHKLLNENDFISYKCGDVSIFVKNIKGTIKCFANICLHRFNSIHCENEGNGHNICTYHNWVYDDNGIPILRSNSIKEELSKCSRSKLEEFEVDFCGDLLFVKINLGNKISLKEQLGDFYDKLIHLSRNFNNVINDNVVVLDHKANWKLLVENVLECYHCSSVHKNTLVPIGIGGKKPENHYFQFGNDKVDYPMRLTALQKEREEKLSFMNKSLYDHKSLQHWYIFPNLFLTSTAGNLFYVGRLTPVEADYTQLHAQFILPCYADLTKREEMLLRAYASSSIDSAINVINEDRQILEEIQKNINLIPNESQVFGEEEFRIESFHRYIKNIVNY